MHIAGYIAIGIAMVVIVALGIGKRLGQLSSDPEKAHDEEKEGEK